MTSTLSNVSARSVAFALYQLDLPAVHPDSVIRCVKSVTQRKSELGNLAETDPAIAIAVLGLCRQNNIEFSFDTLNFQQIINQLPVQILLKTFLNLKTFDVDNFHSQIPIADFNRTSAARAFAARLIAAKTGTNEGLSFLAALFADIGLLAIAELFPKSLSQLLEESQGDFSALLRLEKENLGLTHNIVSRQLAQKWLLPPAIADSAWLYCTDAVQKLGNLANIEIISTVRLADMLVKNIISDQPVAIPATLAISEDDINEIKEKLKNFIRQLNIVEEKQDNVIIRQALNSLLEDQGQQKFSDFLSAVWPAVKPVSSAIGAAGIICQLICKIYDAQKVCIYIDAQGAQKETVKTAGDKLEFLTFENLPSLEEIDFAPAETRQIKLDTIGEMFIQSRENVDISSIASLAAQIISAKLIEEHNFSIAQALIDDFTPSPKEQPAKRTESSNDLRDIIAEIAAGAAHELNNPLTVISGRAQLLMQNETDETKRLVLSQIAEKTGSAYEIVGQLMRYARPASPQTRTVSPFIMVNNCLEKVNARYLSEPLDIKLENIENLSDIEVDAEQIAEAIAQIIYNALESYESGNGLVLIAGSEPANQNFIEISIKDSGCGMSDETLRKAAEPFYSDKPAGRQRGMGLALASSLLKNNNCTMTIESKPDKGTTVTITLPKAG